jgi:hypothetical protein
MTFQPYRSPSTGLRVRAVLFDAFGTMAGWRTGVGSRPRPDAPAWRRCCNLTMPDVRVLLPGL